MIGNKSDCSGLALARDVCEFFDAEATAGERVTTPAEPTVVMSDGEHVLELAQAVFDTLYGLTYQERDVRSADGTIPGIVVYKFALTAKRLGFKETGKRLEEFEAGLTGKPFVRRGDGSPWQPATVSTLKVVKPEDYEGEAAGAGLVADVSEFFKGE